MTKTKKKRNKAYTGTDAAVPTGEVIHRYKAVQRSRAGQWWHDHKRVIKIGGITIAVVAFVIWLIVELILLIF